MYFGEHATEYCCGMFSLLCCVHFSPAAKASVGSEKVQEDLSSSPQAKGNVGSFIFSCGYNFL